VDISQDVASKESKTMMQRLRDKFKEMVGLLDYRAMSRNIMHYNVAITVKPHTKI
jgi:hypothetical protein